MALNSTGPISLAGSTLGQSIALELNQSATAQISLNDSIVRGLINIVSGQISLSQFYGASAFIAKGLFTAGTVTNGIELLDMTTETSANTGQSMSGISFKAVGHKSKIGHFGGQYPFTVPRVYQPYVYAFDLNTSTYGYVGNMPTPRTIHSMIPGDPKSYSVDGREYTAGTTTFVGETRETASWNWNNNAAATIAATAEDHVRDAYYGSTATNAYGVQGSYVTLAVTTPYNFPQTNKFNFATELFQTWAATCPYLQYPNGVVQNTNSMWWQAGTGNFSADGYRYNNVIYQNYNLDVSKILTRCDFATETITAVGAVGNTGLGHMGGSYGGNSCKPTAGYEKNVLVTGSISPGTTWSTGLTTAGGNIGEKLDFASQTWSSFNVWVFPSQTLAPSSTLSTGASPIIR